MLSCSLIIPAYNAAQSIGLVLEALTKQTLPQNLFECIVVDDGSTDTTAEIIQSFADRLPLTYLYQENQGQGNARNYGLTHATGRIIVLLQADTIPSPRTLEEHLNVHDTFPEEHIACVGFTTWDPAVGITPLMYFMEHGGHQFAYEKAAGFPVYPETTYPALPYTYFYTSNISLKRALLSRESFDPAFTTYGWEDIELGYRLMKKEKLQLLYNKEAQVLHHEFISEERWEQKTKSIGKNGVFFERMCQEVRVLPHGYKKILFRLLASPFWLYPAQIAMKLFPHRITYFAYYYGKMKQLTFAGMAEARAELARS